MIATSAPSTFPGWLVEIATVAPVFTLLIAAAAIVPAWVAIFRNAASNRQAHWWSEAQWAMSACFSVNPDEQKAGLRMLGILATASWLGEHELEVLDAAYGRPLREITSARPPAVEGVLAEEIAPPQEATRPLFTETQHEVHLEAARLKVALDGRLQRKTPQWIMDLANS